MIEALEKKVEKIAEKYADLVEKRIDDALNENLTEGVIYEKLNSLNEINEGIRMLNHLAGTLQKISACDMEASEALNKD